MKKIICISLAVIGAVLTFSAVSTMDYYMRELITDFPNYLYWMLGGGATLMLPAVIYGLLEGDK